MTPGQGARAPAAVPADALGPALLFCPADRPERYPKAADRADVVILDLEDAVAPDSKAAAREALRASDLDPSRTVVRVNAVGTLDFVADLETVRATPYRTVMLAKTESARDVAAVVDGIGDGAAVLALVETARGVLAATQIAAADGVLGLMWGAEDLVASLGGTASRHPDGHYRDAARHARSTVLLAARAHSRVAIDAVHLDIEDLGGLAREAADAVASGFAATACIHPSQVAVVRDAYRPREQEVVWARGVLAAAEGERGVFRHDGRMVDAPVLRHAEAVLRRHEAATHAGP